MYADSKDKSPLSTLQSPQLRSFSPTNQIFACQRIEGIDGKCFVYLLQSVGDYVLLLLPGHPEVRDLDDVALADEAVPGGEVAVDAVLRL